ncbi:VWA domain-containing protein [Paenibacillus thalictri]|uniref:VWA domain-containing protein n=2 Tax=Paenibacillus thalictri TaxID=2527873 RepID=A0A4Q9DZV7_9BACL|nr:VWA domain-containing protein [Paenibacillus thalictri]
MDAVLSVDVSNSMNESDPKNLGYEAMKMFIDMSMVDGDKIGVVAYTDQIIREKALVKLNSPESKQELKRFIDELNRGPYTDVAAGVDEAVKILESTEGEQGRTPLIVLLTDGNNSLNNNQTQEQSDAKLSQALQKANNRKIPIYTIGLNADGKLNSDFLKRISAETGGKSFSTNSAGDLPKILSEIYADHQNLKVIPLEELIGNGDFQDVKVTIPNASVAEANISMISKGAVEVKLTDPSGKEQALSSPNIIYTVSSAYSLVKLLSPIQGEWNLKVKGVDKDKIDISLVYNYDIQLMMSPLSATSYKQGDIIPVRAQLVAAGQPVEDPNLYKNLKATLLVTDITTKQKSELQLTIGAQAVDGKFEIKDAHEYELRAKVEDANFVRESPSIKVSAIANTSVTAAAVPPTKALVAETKTPWSFYAIVAAILLVISIGTAFGILAWKKATRGFVGQFELVVKDEDTGDKSSPQYKRLSTFRGRVQLHQLLQLLPEFAETKNLIFRPGKGDTLILENRSGCIVEKGGRVVEASKGLEIRINDRVHILLKQTNKSVSLEYLR